jgi:proteasome accessory factor A
MTERLLGMETEYGFSAVARKGAQGENGYAAEALMDLAEGFTHLPALRSSGIFLANGSRLYIDCGNHPELATPECANPWDVCRYLQAGDRMLVDLAAQLMERDRGIARVMVMKSNVDYRVRTTWGAHESYLYRGVSQQMLSAQIIPHLVSRIIYTGAGGFDCFSAGVDFMLSPRVAHLHRAVSAESTNERRGIFHTRDEPLCGRGHHRLHVICGESLCGETGAWLKVATTALVVALIEAGKNPVGAIKLVDPLLPMRKFAGDPTCSVRPEFCGAEMTALEVQRQYLAQAEAHAGDDFMPPWAGEVCRHWRAMLDRLEHGSAAVAKTLDWAIKLSLFQNHARRRGTTLEKLALWTPFLNGLAGAVERTEGGPHTLTAEFALAPSGPVASLRKKLTPLLRMRGLDWDALPSVLALRMELFEIDTRYALLGDGGIFGALDRSGVLDHHFPGVDNIPHAEANPPAVGRAAIRGAAIRRVAGQNGRFAAEWDGVWDLEDGHRLDLTDPFCATEHWKPERRDPPEPDPARLFREGRYAELLALFPPGGPVLTEDAVLSCARLGHRRMALSLLDTIHPEGDPRRLVLRIWIHTTGLTPDVDALTPLFEAGDALIEEMPDFERDYIRFVYLFCKALYLMESAHLADAKPILTSLVGNPANIMRSRMLSRTLCHLGELHRRQGRTARALEFVHRAEQTHRQEGLLGDLAMHSLPMLAKMVETDSEAFEILRRAETIHRQQRNNLGIAHTLCIRARRLRSPELREEIERLFAGVEVLTTCKTARRILNDWDTWLARPSGDEPVDYWGL